MFTKTSTRMLTELLFIIAKNKKSQNVRRMDKKPLCIHTMELIQTIKSNQLLVNNRGENQNNYALRNQTKKVHSFDFIYIWFKTGKTNIFVTEVRIVFILGECNYWETMREIPPVLVLFYALIQ